MFAFGVCVLFWLLALVMYFQFLEKKKIITKIIIKRLKPLLDLCILSNQSPFASGCSIQDNILITHEMFLSFKSKKSYAGANEIKLDLEKGYDFLNWDFIRFVLLKFGFVEKWVNLIMECITSMSFSVLINDTTHGYFYPKHGIR